HRGDGPEGRSGMTNVGNFARRGLAALCAVVAVLALFPTPSPAAHHRHSTHHATGHRRSHHARAHRQSAAARTAAIHTRTRVAAEAKPGDSDFAAGQLLLAAQDSYDAARTAFGQKRYQDAVDALDPTLSRLNDAMTGATDPRIRNAAGDLLARCG